MALLAPVAGAAIGGAGAFAIGGSSWITAGMSVGWLIGSWLMGPQADEKNKVIDPGAEEMPRFNQALRGTTMTIMWGTNRVNSNIVWQKNFNVIRNETRSAGAGGGKFGGSGMGGKGPAKGGSGEISYEYKWDLLYHIGMSVQQMNLFSGWLGGERLNDSTIATITGISGGSPFSSSSHPDAASLSFDDAHFQGAVPTSSNDGENWDHFQTEEDTVTRWPFTAWVGFKQLYLGHNAYIPQLTWEIGPGDVQLDFDSGFVSAPDNNGSVDSPFLSAGPAISADGTPFTVKANDGNNLKTVNLKTGAVVTYTDAQIETLIDDAGLDPSDQYDFTAGYTFGSALAETDYVLVGAGAISGGHIWAFALCRIGNDGTLTALGGYIGDSSDGRMNAVAQFLACGLSGDSGDSRFPLIFMNNAVGGTNYPIMIALPTIGDMDGGAVLEDSGGDDMDQRYYDMTTTYGEFFGTHGSHRTYIAFGWFMPTLTELGAAGTRFYFYVGKSDIEWHNDNPAASDNNSYIDGKTGDYPNGFIAYADVEAGPNGVTSVPAPTVDNANWITDAGNSVVPFSDAGFKLDGTTVSDEDDYDPIPTVQKIDAGAGTGGYVVIFSKNITNTDDRGDNDEYNRLQIFIYNPLSKEATRYTTGDGATIDSVVDLGTSEDTYDTYTIRAFWDQSDGTLYMFRSGIWSSITDPMVISFYGTLSISGGSDVLPPKIIYDILTHKAITPFNVSTSQIDQDSYDYVLAKCDAEDIRISTQYTREEDPLSVIDLLLETYGGYLIDSGGKIKFGIQEFTDVASVVRTVDNDHLIPQEKGAPPVTITRGAPQDTYNMVKVNYIDRNIEYRQNFVELSDEVSQDLYGVRAHEFPPQFVMSEKTALRIAARALWSNLYARDIYDFTLGWKDMDLEPGDTITLVDSHFPELQTGAQVRLTRKIERERGKFNFQAVDEISYIYQSSGDVNSVTQASSNPLFGPTLPPAFSRAYELPKEFQGTDASVFIGYRQLTPTMGARLYLSDVESGSYAQVMDATPYIISGTFNETLPSRDPGYVEENVEVYLMPASGFDAASPTWAQTHALDDVAAGGRSVGAGLIWAGSEMLAYQGVNLISQNRYRLDYVWRGWGGTHIHNHSSGDNWHKHGAGILSIPFNEDKIGTTIYYKVAPYNFNGVEYDISSIAANSYQIQGTYYRPQVPPEIATFIESPVTGTNSDDIRGLEVRAVTTGGCDLVFEWPDAARDKGYGAGGYGNGDYGRFTTDTTSHNWRVEVISADGSTVVRSTFVSTGHYTYTLEANSEDFNGWAGDISVRVTPYNDVGDAVRSRTRTLRLFEQV